MAIKKGCVKAKDAAAEIGVGLQAFCIPGSVAENRQVGRGHGNLGAMLLDDAEITLYEDNKPIVPDPEDPGRTKPTKMHPQRPRFKFSMVNIPIGSELTFVPTGVKVKVASDDQIEYEGRIYKLSPFVGTFMPEDKRNTSGAYQGAKFFTYRGRILDDLRTEKEKNEPIR